MRQASWNEMFEPRHPPQADFVLAPEVPEEPRGWRRLLWWEDLLTFGLLGVIYLTAVASIQRAEWVDEMPALFPIALFGLVLAALLARVRWPEGFIHLLALPAGVAAILAQILAAVPGPHPVERFQTLTTRMGAWFDAAFTGGISNDSLPFIIVVVALTWLAAYMSAWAVFRWQNAWLGLAPGGSALLVNIGFQAGEFSFAFVFFLFAAALLLTRLHLLQQAKAWRERSTPYPPFLSLSVLHATFWAGLLLLGLAWAMPQANEVGPLESAWERATAPVVDRAAELSRLFVSVRGGDTDALLRRFGDTLPFRGSLNLSNEEILDIVAEHFQQPQYLRGDVYQIYTPEGWQQLSESETTLRAGGLTAVDVLQRLRDEIEVRVVSKGRTGDTVFSVGQPRSVDQRAEVRRGTNTFADILSVENAGGRVRSGQVYNSEGSVSVASVEDLRAAGTDYPYWVEERYLQLPHELPRRVRDLAARVTRSETDPYDRAVAIETYVRNNYEYTLDVPDVPLGEDAIEFFLFESKQGYFDYHASAMVVLLRSIGIPSRLAIGYVLRDGESRPDGLERYAVTEADAFAWPEVYFPGLGWVEFNPTPAPGLGPIVRPGALTHGGPATDAAAEGDILPFADLPILFPDAEDGGGGAASHTGSSGNGRWLLTGLVIGLGVMVVSAGGGLGYAWVRGLSALDEPARFWGQTQRLASWARLPLDATKTPREYARHLRDEVPGADDADLLADAYVRYRYGRWRPNGAERSRLEEAWRAVRGGLLRRLFRLPGSRVEG